ncbi:MAG: copper-translocating P-type ATPase [Peptostreptococcus sp.]|uniref:copper-translocating P-type ATPase n=1 Tax=Peptostreptococcus sp. TaxID=1262 RepID=UPI002FCAD16A
MNHHTKTKHSKDEMVNMNHEAHQSHENHGHQKQHKHEGSHACGGHDEHGGHDHSGHAQMFRKKFFVSLVFGIPILIFSPMMGKHLPFTYTFPGSEWLVIVLATVLFFYGGSPFLQGAKDELKSKKPAMMTLVSLGISVAYIYSIYAFISNNILYKPGYIHDFFWELSSLILIMLLGHWIEMNAVTNAGSALKSLAELLPNSALLVQKDGTTVEMDLSDIQKGDVLQVLPGERVPTDGIVKTGLSFVNESMLTGESVDIKKNISDTVIGGSINGSGTLTIEVTGTGESGYLAQVMDLVNTAQQDKSKAESMSDVVAGLLFYFAIVVGTIAFITWIMLQSGTEFALERLVTVLVIACPHALGLAIPLVTARSTSIAAQNGLLIQNRQSLETARKVDVIVMDKTGTLTEGNFAVSEFSSLSPEYSNEEVLRLIGALEEGSSHPLAVGVLNKIEELKLKSFKADNITNIAGAGLEANINESNFKLVSASYLDRKGIVYDKARFKSLASQGNSVSYLLKDGDSIGIIGQGDQIKPESKKTIEGLLKQGIRPIMLTGDNRETAEKVAKKLGIKEMFAEARPEDKEKIVRKLQSQGLVVMMVGDGVNDAPSLARADIGLAIGAGTDVAIDSADVILVKSNPSDILHFLELAKKTTRKTVQNLWWGAGYNILAVPLAAGVLAPFNIILSPAVGAVLMSLSTVIVAINAMTLKINS